MGNWNPGFFGGFFGGLGSGERGSGRPDMDGVNRGGAKSGGGVCFIHAYIHLLR